MLALELDRSHYLLAQILALPRPYLTSNIASIGDARDDSGPCQFRD